MEDKIKKILKEVEDKSAKEGFLFFEKSDFSNDEINIFKEYCEVINQDDNKFGLFWLENLDGEPYSIYEEYIPNT